MGIFSGANAVIVGAGAFVTAVLAFLPIDMKLGIPPEFGGTVKAISGILCLFAAILIAFAHNGKYRKSRNRTIMLSLAIFLCGLMALGSQMLLNSKWVLSKQCYTIEESTGNEISVMRYIVLSPTRFDRISSAKNDAQYRKAASDFMCLAAVSTQFYEHNDSGNGARKLILTLLSVLTITGLFSGITLLAWSLAALKPTNRQSD
jgi:hypothetical protein